MQIGDIVDPFLLNELLVFAGCHTTCLQVGDMVASCPCADGLKCVPDGGHVVPQGPTGKTRDE